MRAIAVTCALVVLMSLTAACNDEALNEFGAAGAGQSSVTVQLYDGWIGSPETDQAIGPGLPLQVTLHPHNDVTIHVINMGAAVHAFALYADEAGTELLVQSQALPPGATEELRFHFHDAQIAYFFDDGHRKDMRGEFHVYE
ncbi:MAG: hypothetical protein O3A10_05470 [Chloroflexi bacterium]|nr:hypothetical protein [Chloroflexota bacterium]MDA1146129.1 hypothetical protein [Chloroflexota bacterium]